jgi:hypothetical protein
MFFFFRSRCRYKEAASVLQPTPRRDVVTLNVMADPRHVPGSFWRTSRAIDLAALHPDPGARAGVCALGSAPKGRVPDYIARKTPGYRAAGEVALVAAVLMDPPTQEIKSLLLLRSDRRVFVGSNPTLSAELVPSSAESAARPRWS